MLYRSMFDRIPVKLAGFQSTYFAWQDFLSFGRWLKRLFQGEVVRISISRLNLSQYGFLSADNAVEAFGLLAINWQNEIEVVTSKENDVVVVFQQRKKVVNG